MKLITDFYEKVIWRELPLSDQLAAVRSILANERTFLSYQRTALTLAVAGFSFIRFFDYDLIVFIGWIFLPAALITVILGVIRYLKMRDMISNLESDHVKDK